MSRGIFGGTPPDEIEPVVDPGPFADDLALLKAKVQQLTEERDDLKKLLEGDPARKRRAMRRLAGGTSDVFEQVIDLVYLWHEHEPNMQISTMFRAVFNEKHTNIGDRETAIVLQDLIRKARLARLNGMISRLGLDEAEKLLSAATSKPQEPPQEPEPF